MNEVEVLKQKTDLFRELLDMQISIEEEENEEVRKFQELKLRKITDHLDQKWFYKEEFKKEIKSGSLESDQGKAPVTDKLKDRLEQKGIIDPEKR